MTTLKFLSTSRKKLHTLYMTNQVVLSSCRNKNSGWCEQPVDQLPQLFICTPCHLLISDKLSQHVRKRYLCSQQTKIDCHIRTTRRNANYFSCRKRKHSHSFFFRQASYAVNDSKISSSRYQINHIGFSSSAYAVMTTTIRKRTKRSFSSIAVLRGRPAYQEEAV